MEKFDQALDSAKAALRDQWFAADNSNQDSIVLQRLILAVDLLGDEVAKLKEKKHE